MSGRRSGHVAAEAGPAFRSGLRVLAVDDEAPALADLSRLLRSLPAVDDLETASSGREALVKLAAAPFDALFLDVRMPGLDGVELARVLKRFAVAPEVVFVTAYETAAVEAFELRAVDYLMKPVSRARVTEALARVAAARPRRPEQRPADLPEPAGEDGVIPVENLRGGTTRLLPRNAILYVQAHGDYVRIYADDGRFHLRAALSDIERRWEPFGFVRVHRGYVVNLRRATELRALLGGGAVLVFPDGSEVPIARRQVADLRRRLRV